MSAPPDASPSTAEEVNTSQTPFFNLVDEPWIPVLTLDGRESLFSLKQVFDSAESVRQIQGELPTMLPALIRILIAILSRSLGLPKDPGDWARRTENWRLVTQAVERYLSEHHERFWLRHPETPFFQVADLGPSTGDTKDLGAIVADFPANVQAFTQRGPNSLTRMTPAEAARWVIHAQAYDPSGIKTPDRRDPRAKGGKVYPLGTGWMGKGEVLIVGGDTLADTLRLNYIAPDGRQVISHADDLPPWERRHPGPVEEFEPPAAPRGFIQVYTWQARRLRLIFDGPDVVRVVLCYGDPLGEQNRNAVDPMMTWRYSKRQSDKLGTTVYMPGMVEPSKAMWRSLASWLPTRAQAETNGHARFKEPGILEWIGRLSKHGLLGTNFLPYIDLFGVQYGSNSSTYAEVVDDSLRVPPFLLAEDAVDAAEMVIRAIDDAESVAWYVGTLATNLARARGIETAESLREEAREEAYVRSGELFVEWLDGLKSDSEWHLARRGWQQTVRHDATELAERLALEAGTQSFFGRIVDPENDTWLTTDIALNYFRRGLRKSLPLAFEEKTRVDQ